MRKKGWGRKAQEEMKNEKRVSVERVRKRYGIRDGRHRECERWRGCENDGILGLRVFDRVGGNRADAIVAASAIHLMHVDMYVHEHMLLSDRVEPQPTIPHKFSPKIELMTGDGIMPFGFELLAGSIDPASNNGDKILRVIIEISRAIGSEAMISDEDYEANIDYSSGQQIHRLHESSWSRVWSNTRRWER
ncbi:heterodimeric geranylgeranyl pyrophosphate synthase small subunit, chloroplastic-like protein [Tanacetum coccineum]